MKNDGNGEAPNKNIVSLKVAEKKINQKPAEHDMALTPFGLLPETDIEKNIKKYEITPNGTHNVNLRAFRYDCFSEQFQVLLKPFYDLACQIIETVVSSDRANPEIEVNFQLSELLNLRNSYMNSAF